MSDNYRQCCLEKPNAGGGTVCAQGWIPEEFAKIGKSLKMENDDGSWEFGWKVVGIGGRKTRAQVKYDSKDGDRMMEKDA